MNNIGDIIKYLKEYDGNPVTIMEVCGTHTASIAENGIENIVSEKIHLITGPGCPVCVTVAAYIDKLCELSRLENHCVCSFGDMIRVKGSKECIRDAQAQGGRIKMVYSPLELVDLAINEPETTFVFAAVGFETTTPLYALLLEKLIEKDISNVKLLTALKTMPKVIDTVLSDNHTITGMLAPGHVSVITGSDVFKPFAEKYNIPFVVSGFEGEEILASIYALIKLNQQGKVLNLYPSAVTNEGNNISKNKVLKYFKECDAAWRGLGVIEGSGLKLREEYKCFDAGSDNLYDDFVPKGCSCAQVIAGKKRPEECPLFAKKCSPSSPVGACMVSNEGSCFHHFMNRGNN